MGIWKLLAVAFAAGVLAGCGASLPVPKRASHSARSVLPATPPVQVYAAVARQVHACWFAPGDPVLTHHLFRAEAPARGAPDGETRITIYEKVPDGRLGLKAYSVRFGARGKGTMVTTENHRLPYALGQKLSADVGYWVQGGADCNDPKLPAAPRAAR